MNEKSEDCVLREVKEETGVAYEIDRLAVVCENLFTGKEEMLHELNCHVLEFYYLMKSRGTKEVHSDSYGWNNAKEELVWIPIEKLPETNIKPDFLRTRIPEILKASGVIHIVNDER
jgi:ADP-ribose pyrophosphatase YjhB (NUDIX family)